MSKVPSRQLMISFGTGALGGGGLASYLDMAAVHYGVNVPPGTGAFLAAGITALMHYLQGSGRKSASASEKVQ